MPLTFTPRDAPAAPLELDGLTPDALAGASLFEIARRTVRVGNAREEVGALFTLTGDPADGHLIFAGGLERARGVGAGMAAGRITVHGGAGHHLGAAMSGGTIEVNGPAGDWAGAMMRGGLLRIEGDAGDHLGAARPGERLGMREGVILVRGGVGACAGLALRRGLIAVAGAAGDDLGHGLIAGSIIAFGPVGKRPGAGLKRGTIALLGTTPPDLPPTFRRACRYRPPFLAVYLRRLRAWGFPVPCADDRPLVERYNGDLLEGGTGEILTTAISD